MAIWVDPQITSRINAESTLKRSRLIFAARARPSITTPLCSPKELADPHSRGITLRAMAAKPKPRIPRFAYQGGKGKLAKHIVGLLPPSGKRFIEPFAGRGNVYFRVAQHLDYEEFWINDHYMFRFFQALLHMPCQKR